MLADNGGPTQTIAIPDFSIATGSGVLSGIYSKDTLIEGVSTTNYFAVYDEGNGWHRAENDSILPAGIQVTAFSKDQRGYVRANPPCAGAYEAGASPAIVAQGASQTSAFSFKVLSLRGNRLSVSAPYAGNYGITLFNSKGQLLEKRVATLPRGFHQMSLSHFVTRGLYVVSISGFNHKTTLDVVSKLVAIISF